MERRAWFFSLVSAFGDERVACALLEYRPPTPFTLGAVLKQMQKKQCAISYLGDTIWRIMMYFHPKSQIPTFSRYMRELGHPVQEQTGREILDGLIDKLKQRKRR